MVTYFSVRLQGIDEPRKIMALNTSLMMLVPIERGITYKVVLNTNANLPLLKLKLKQFSRASI